MRVGHGNCLAFLRRKRVVLPETHSLAGHMIAQSTMQAESAEVVGTLYREAYFPTFVYRCDFPDADALNERLLDAIHREKEADDSKIEKSNLTELGGWHSHDELHRMPEFADFARRVEHVAAEISNQLNYSPEWSMTIDDMWSIVNPVGSFNRSHIHPGSLWSGVYYVQAPENCGAIKFTDPRTQNIILSPQLNADRPSAKGTWTSVQFDPYPGRILLFPSWLYHAVEPNLTSEQGAASERVCISFNMTQSRSEQGNDSEYRKAASSTSSMSVDLRL